MAERGELYLGLDLGQAADFSALVVIEQFEHAARVPFYRGPEQMLDEAAGIYPEVQREYRYHLVRLERYPLHTPYPAIVRDVAAICRDPAVDGRRTLIVDGTGVGRPVVDLLRDAHLAPVATTVHGGEQTQYDELERSWRVPKRVLVSTARVLLQAGRLKFPRPQAMKGVDLLVDELTKYQVKISDTAHDSYGAWREGQHDDLVFGLCLACWWAERQAGHEDPPVERWAFGGPDKGADKGPRGLGRLG